MHFSRSYTIKITGNISEIKPDNVAITPMLIQPCDCFMDYDSNLKHITRAIARGAAVIISEQQDIEQYTQQVKWVQVKDLKKNIVSIVTDCFDHPSRKLKVVSVTGTNGKTQEVKGFMHSFSDVKILEKYINI